MVQLWGGEPELPSVDELLAHREQPRRRVGAFSAAVDAQPWKPPPQAPSAPVAERRRQDAKVSQAHELKREDTAGVPRRKATPASAAGGAPKQRADVSAPEPATSGAPAKIVLLAWGSRGDVQPVVALALRLKELGLRVTMLVTEGHLEFVRSFSLDVRGYPHICRFDGQAMMNGEAPKDMSHIDSCPQYLAIYEQVKAISPDILLYRESNFLEAWLLEEWLQVCTVEYCFHRDERGDQKRALDCVEDIRRRKGPLERRLGGKVLSTLGVLKAAWLVGSRRPVLYAASEQVAVRDRAWTHASPDAGVHFTGYWVLGQDLQKDTKAKCSVFFGGPQEKELNDFLASHSRVVYIGWGSMFVKSKEFMTHLAVRALMLAGRDGIILGSYHSLGRDMLSGAEDYAALQAYADKHVLWLQWAPHEWLMPRCDVVVHHGGCGTTAASLRSGRPTVITPIAFDQFYWADRVKRTGVGTSTERLAEASAQSLADAIARCESSGMRCKASELGAKLREEDGAGYAANFLAEYLEKEVKSGNWKRSALGPAAAELAVSEQGAKPEAPREDLARGRPVLASSCRSNEKIPENAVDGTRSTRWTSEYSDHQWIEVNLGDAKAVSSVEVEWETAYAKNYIIQGCADGQHWAQLASVSGHEGWVITKLHAGTTAHWIRLQCQERATHYGFSIWNFRVFA